MKRKRAVKIVEKIIDDLCDRCDLQETWEAIDFDLQGEIMIAWVEIIMTNANGGKQTPEEA